MTLSIEDRLCDKRRSDKGESSRFVSVYKAQTRLNQPWHRPQDRIFRENIRATIGSLLEKTISDPFKLEHEARKRELKLYNHASSLDEYLDCRTLSWRVTSMAKKKAYSVPPSSLTCDSLKFACNTCHQRIIIGCHMYCASCHISYCQGCFLGASHEHPLRCLPVLASHETKHFQMNYEQKVLQIEHAAYCKNKDCQKYCVRLQKVLKLLERKKYTKLGRLITSRTVMHALCCDNNDCLVPGCRENQRKWQVIISQFSRATDRREQQKWKNQIKITVN